MDADLSKMGNNLVTKFHVLMRISQIYDSKNVALQQFTQESLQAINTMIEREGNLSLKMVKNDLYLNDQRLRYSVGGLHQLQVPHHSMAKTADRRGDF